MSTTTSTMPKTIRELGNMAEARGVTVTELLVELWPDAALANTSAVTS
jgi:hypothetical protein